MKKVAVAVCLIGLVFLVFIIFPRVDEWAVPGIEVIVTDQGGQPLIIKKSDVSIKNSVIAEVAFEIQGDGRVIVPPQKIWTGINIGNPFYRTVVTIDPEGYKTCEEEVSLSGGDVYGGHLPGTFRSIFSWQKTVLR